MNRRYMVAHVPTLFALIFLLTIPDSVAQPVAARPTGPGGTPPPVSPPPGGEQISNVGVQLGQDFTTTGNFTVQLRVEPQVAPPPADFLNQFNNSISHVNCTVGAPTPLCCSCDGRTVIAGSGGEALDVAIDIDSSGSNDPDAVPDPSDPNDDRLTAAQQVVEALLTGNNHVATFVFGTNYCPGARPCTDETDPGAFLRGLQKLGSVTYRFSSGYVDALQKEGLRVSEWVNLRIRSV